MMRDCAKGKIDRILVKSISRFARNTQDCLEAVRQLRIMGVSVFFEKENIDTADMTSEMLLCVHSAGAQQESISISENMRWSYKHRIGNVITQKTYVKDFLTHKQEKNRGEVPQHLIENNHQPIIAPEVFRRVQEMKGLALSQTFEPVMP